MWSPIQYCHISAAIGREEVKIGGGTTLDKDTQQSLGFHSLSVNCGGPEESHVQINNNFVLQ